jgi:hypothetical protein
MGKKKELPFLAAEECEQLDCCGLFEMSGLTTDPEEALMETVGYNSYTTVKRHFENLPGRALIATTIKKQKKEAEALKAHGFTKVSTWKNGNTGNTVTLWFKKPPKRMR